MDDTKLVPSSKQRRLSRLFGYTPTPQTIFGATILVLLTLVCMGILPSLLNLYRFPIVLFPSVIVFLSLGLTTILGIFWGVNIISSQLRNKTTTWAIVFVAVTIHLLLFYETPRIICLFIHHVDLSHYATVFCLVPILVASRSVWNGIKRYRSDLTLMRLILTTALATVTIVATLFYFSADILASYPLDAWNVKSSTGAVIAKNVLFLALLALALIEKPSYVSYKNLGSSFITFVSVACCALMFGTSLVGMILFIINHVN